MDWSANLQTVPIFIFGGFVLNWWLIIVFCIQYRTNKFRILIVNFELKFLNFKILNAIRACRLVYHKARKFRRSRSRKLV